LAWVFQTKERKKERRLGFSGAGAPSPSGFSFCFWFYKQVLLWVVGGGGFHDKRGLGSQKILSSLRTFTNEAERTLDLPKRQRHKPLVVNVIVVGPFQEEEVGTGVASDVVKVEGEDLDTPGYLRGDRVRLGRRRSRIMGASLLARSR